MNKDAKVKRVLTALNHAEPDRVPVGEFFWTSFLKRAKSELAGGGDFNPYAHWDLDMIVVTPNMDPHISGIRILEDSGDRKLVKTGFEATIELRSGCPMPIFRDFSTKTFEQMESFVFDDPADARRFASCIDDQINSVGDALNLGYPSYAERVEACAKDFCVFGSVCEPNEMIWRMIGTENLFIKIGEEPGRVAAFIERLGDFLVGITKAQIKAGNGRLSGLYIWGDIAYDGGMFFSPSFWRSVYKPQLRRICDAAHEAGLKTIYHGCGNASAVLDDLIEAGIDALNPIEAKAGLDVVALKRKYGKRLAFNGNMDVRVLATNDRAKVRREVMRKLNAAKGGGYILQSDHSIPDNVDPATYDYIIRLVREFGRYPLDLGEFDEDISGGR
ncbi:MAG TPA: uroporphyrinogen decarboxylase family protein [Candidatus Brocadiia bacterium]|nr:uroporphyrinogen decarboxylase family protein [Candidatus Brocadiia bacterium]